MRKNHTTTRYEKEQAQTTIEVKNLPLGRKSTILARIVIGLRAAGINVKFEDSRLQHQLKDITNTKNFTNDPDFFAPVLIVNAGVELVDTRR